MGEGLRRVDLRRRLPWITGGVVAVALVWAFLYLTALHPFGAVEARLKRDELPGIGLSFRDARLVGRQDSQMAWAFDAKTIDVSRDRRLVTFRGVTDGSLMKDGREVASLVAGKVVYNSMSNNLVVQGKAEVRLADGPTLEVRNIYWNAQKSKLVCTGGIRAVFDEGTMEGDRMVADLEKKELTVSKVRGTILLPEE